MTDLQEDHDNHSEQKKPRTFSEILLGFGLSAGAYLLIFLVTFGSSFQTIHLIFDFIILAAFVFLTVRYSRTGHKTAAVIMLILISPAILLLLLTGACFLSLKNTHF